MCQHSTPCSFNETDHMLHPKIKQNTKLSYKDFCFYV
jgi:hypothetical protein